MHRVSARKCSERWTRKPKHEQEKKASTPFSSDVRGLTIIQPDSAIDLDTAVVLGKVGRPEKGKEKGDDITFTRGSTGVTYILARLDRDGQSDPAARVRALHDCARGTESTEADLFPFLLQRPA